MRRKKTGRRGIHPAAAGAFLLVSVVVASVSLRGSFGTRPGVGDASSMSAPGMDPESEPTTSVPEGQGPGYDLLAKHGSWDGVGPVRMAFATLSAAAVSAAPAGETKPSELGRWTGEDPPELKLSVLMVGSAVRRAVVQGVVVGIGDAICQAEVVAIEKDILYVVWGGRRLTYDFEGGHPREFRSELRRRAAAVSDEAARADTNKTQENRK